MTKNTTQGIQLWTVPATGSYTIICAGARGGATSFGSGGLGAVVTITANLSQSDVLQIAVGQMGLGTSSEAGGGGGGTFVISNGSALVIAGGGGGAGGYQQSTVTQSGRNASSSTSGTNSYPGSGQYYLSDGIGGTSGNGGTGGQSHRPGGGGGGYSGNGGSYTAQYGGGGYGVGGTSFTNGASGGLGENANISGGFGGGGGGDLGGGGGGGGGTWSGYGSGDWGKGGGGGGSYYIGTLQSSGTNSGDGYVTITPNFTISTGSTSVPYNLASYAATTTDVTTPYNDSCTTVVVATGPSQYDSLPVVTFGSYNWLLLYNFGVTGRWSGYQLRNYTDGTISVSQNYPLPSAGAPIQTDWSSSQTSATYGIAGYKDGATTGPNNIYTNWASLFNVDSGLGSLTNPMESSSMMMYIPSWVRQVCLVAADYYRAQGSTARRNSYWWSTNGTSWTYLGKASWRGTGSSGAIPQNPSTDADMLVFNVTGAGYLLILETGYTIASVGFVLLKP